MITIVDYGLGNIRAFLNVYKRLNIPATTARGPDELAKASKIILPGVGSFDHAMEQLAQSGMRQELDKLVLQQKVPVLGVCVGMQMLAHGSDEGAAAGLGWVNGRVKALASIAAGKALPVPHMGWNSVRPERRTRLFDQLDNESRFYFLHSYYFDCADNAAAIARASYGVDFPCAVNAGNVYGVQFHPEKSHRSGTQLLQNFAEM